MMQDFFREVIVIFKTWQNFPSCLAYPVILFAWHEIAFFHIFNTIKGEFLPLNGGSFWCPAKGRGGCGLSKNLSLPEVQRPFLRSRHKCLQEKGSNCLGIAKQLFKKATAVHSSPLMNLPDVKRLSCICSFNSEANSCFERARLSLCQKDVRYS